MAGLGNMGGMGDRGDKGRTGGASGRMLTPTLSPPPPVPLATTPHATPRTSSGSHHMARSVWYTKKPPNMPKLILAKGEVGRWPLCNRYSRRNWRGGGEGWAARC